MRKIVTIMTIVVTVDLTATTAAAASSVEGELIVVAYVAAAQALSLFLTSFSF
jgi:hypothetical protein